MYDYNKSNDNQGLSQRIRSNMESDLALPCYLSTQRFIRYPVPKLLHLTTAPSPELVFHLLVLLSKKSFNPVRSPSLLPFPRCPPSSPMWPPLLQQVNLFVGLQVCSWYFLSVRVYLLSNIFLGGGRGHTLHCLRGLSSPTRNQTCAPTVQLQSLNYWTAREVFALFFIA